jgi:hypothetical protein
MRRVALLLVIFTAASAHAAETHCSPNGRFCATFHYIDRDDGGYPAQLITDASGRVLRDIQSECSTPLLTNDGRYLVCAPYWYHDHKMRTYRIDDGARIAEAPISDFLTDNDLHEFPEAPGEWTLREGGSSPQLVFPMPSSRDKKEHEDVVVDAWTGALLTVKHDIYPPRVAELREPGEPRPWSTTVCSGKALAFDAPRSVEMDVRGLLENESGLVLPRYPLIARKARLEGYVNVQIVTDGDGNVCRRTTLLPFGIDAAVVDAIGQWTYRKLWKVDPTRLIQSTFSFRFALSKEDDHLAVQTRPVS